MRMNLSHQNGLPERTGHEANEGEIIVYQPNSTLRLEVKVDGTTAEGPGEANASFPMLHAHPCYP